MDKRRREHPHDETEERDRRLARELGDYVDRPVEHGHEDSEVYLADRPELASALGPELEIIERISGIMEDTRLPRLFGDFRLLRNAGQGGMGTVYEARQISLDRRVALKVMPPALLAAPKSVERFFRAAEALLREAISGERARVIRLWEAWQQVAMADLELTPAEMLAVFPNEGHEKVDGDVE